MRWETHKITVGTQRRPRGRSASARLYTASLSPTHSRCIIRLGKINHTHEHRRRKVAKLRRPTNNPFPNHNNLPKIKCLLLISMHIHQFSTFHFFLLRHKDTLEELQVLRIDINGTSALHWSHVFRLLEEEITRLRKVIYFSLLESARNRKVSDTIRTLEGGDDREKMKELFIDEAERLGKPRWDDYYFQPGPRTIRAAPRQRNRLAILCRLLGSLPIQLYHNT